MESSHRPLTVRHATALVVANMIGTGIFTTTGFLIQDLHRPGLVLLAWWLGGMAALSGALVYGELGAMLPHAGGEVVYLSRAFHPAVGFVAGWISLVVGFAAPVAASAVAFGHYLRAALPQVPPVPAAIGLIVLLSVAHAWNVRFGGRLQVGVTLVKVVLITSLLLGGALVGEGDLAHLSLALPGDDVSAGSLAVSLIFVSYAYSGWNGAAYVAGEVAEPSRNVPRALLAGTLLVTSLYLGLNLLFLYAVPPADLAGKVEVGHVAAAALFGPAVGRALSLAISLALVSSVSAMVLAGPRVAVALAERRLVPAALGRRREGGAPAVAIALQALLASAFAVTATFDSLLIFVGFTLSLIAALTVIACWVLRIREPDVERPFRVPGWPVPALVFLALSLWMAGYAVFSRPLESLAGVGVVGVGLLGYAAATRRIDPPAGEP